MTPVKLAELAAKLAGLLFIVSSMLAMGLSLTVAQIGAPLRDVRLGLVRPHVQRERLVHRG